MLAIFFNTSPLLALFGLLFCMAVGYLALSLLAVRAQRFRPAAATLGDVAALPPAQRAVLEQGHQALEKLGFRYLCCLARRDVAATAPESLECFYQHTGFDAIAVLSAVEGAPRMVFRSYRPDGWSLETHPSLPLQPLPRPINIEAWTAANAATLDALWQAHLARFKARAKDAHAVLPEPSQLIAHEQHLAADELPGHVASGLLVPVSAKSDQHRLAWRSSLRRVASTGPRAQLMAMHAAGFTFKRMALGIVVLGLCLGGAGAFFGYQHAAALLAEAQTEAQAVGLPRTLAQISDAMSPTERRTLAQGAQWWLVAMKNSAVGTEEATLAALRQVPAEQQKAGSNPPPNATEIGHGEGVLQVLDRAYALLASDLKKQHEAKAQDLFHCDATALATLLRDTHWSLGGKTQAARVQHLMDLLAALETHWLEAGAAGTQTTTSLLAALPTSSDLQRDAGAAYFVDQIAGPAADTASPLARFFRDSTPLGSVSLAGQLRSEIALWQAMHNQCPWSAAALLPSPEQERNVIAQLHQQPSFAQRHAQFAILADYAPRRVLCTAAIAAQMLMQQLPTPELYREPITQALAKLSGTGPGIEIVADAQQPVLQITLRTVPPRLVRWRLRATGK